MRTFYIFKINNMFKPVNNDKASILYKIFSEMYNSKDEDIFNKFRLFERIVIPFNKSIFNNYILLKHGNDLYYERKDSIHTINSKYEVSKLIVNSTYLKVKSNKNINSFMKDIMDSKENVFVVDFKNKDYFYLNEISKETLV